MPAGAPVPARELAVQVVLALAAALLFTLGTVLQQRAGLQAPAAGPAPGC